MKILLKFFILLMIFSCISCRNQPGKLENTPKKPKEESLYEDAEIAAALAGLAGGKGYLPTPLYNESNTVRNPINEDVTFWCRDSNTNVDVQLFANETNISSKVARSKPFVFLIHGWLFNRFAPWVQNMTAAFMNFVPDVNVCSVDWGKLAYYEYDIAARRNVYEVSDFLAQALRKWKINAKQVSIVGHTFGAHIAGQTGQNFNGKIGKIFGIDPAGPIYCHPSSVGPNLRLSPDDAQYVQVISTNRNYSGCGIESGVQTFYPNDGFIQPACFPPTFDTIDSNICSHLIGPDYFTYALDPSNVFTSKKCDCWFSYSVGLCVDNDEDVMRYYAEGKPGKFFIDLKREAPYI